jgi:hypothetical protein
MQKTCAISGQPFTVSDEDRAFYEKMGVPEPTLCPSERSFRRMNHRNEYSLYHRKCDLCEKQIIAMYDSDSKFQVYCQDCFWSDKWNALDHGVEFDFTQPFFEQMKSLRLKAPRLAIINKQSENSDFCNYSFANKNSYLCFGSHYEEDCYYGEYSTKNKNCVDNLWIYQCTYCYSCQFSKNCYECIHVEHTDNAQNCLFSIDLKDCKNCLFSANLRHKEYYIFNKAYSKEGYFQKLAEYQLNTYQGFEKARKYFYGEFRSAFPVRANYQTNCEDCEGGTHENSRNLKQCFDATNSEDCSYGFQLDETHNSMDIDFMGYDKSEWNYENIGCTGTYDAMFCDTCWHDGNLRYSQLCFSSKELFGCISLKNQEFCILNKQYSKKEYEELVPKIITHMKSTGEWGEFFPIQDSVFAYNETLALPCFPMDKHTAQNKGFTWKDKSNKNSYLGPKIEIPDAIENVDDKICEQILHCDETDKLYKIIPHELKFYRKMKIPIPRQCPEKRHYDRMARRKPRYLWGRECQNCNTEVQTSYSPDRPEVIYCDVCYLANIY